MSEPLFQSILISYEPLNFSDLIFQFFRIKFIMANNEGFTVLFREENCTALQSVIQFDKVTICSTIVNDNGNVTYWRKHVSFIIKFAGRETLLELCGTLGIAACI